MNDSDSPVASDAEDLVDQVRDRYASIARGTISGCCGGGTSCATPEETAARSAGYRSADLAALPEGVNLGLGCGAPVDHLGLRAGEIVVDLGSGGGIDALLAARRVGPAGRVVGVDMTPEMLDRARGAAARAGFSNVEFLEGRLEALPLPDGFADAVTSNCVINLVPDKRAVFREIARVLRPGGRLVISDIVLDGRLPAAVERSLLAYVGCVAGALLREEYFRLLEEAGLGGPEVLRDVDSCAAAEMLPQDIEAALAREGVSEADLRGRVRSVTYRAWKRLD